MLDTIGISNHSSGCVGKYRNMFIIINRNRFHGWKLVATVISALYCVFPATLINSKRQPFSHQSYVAGATLNDANILISENTLPVVANCT